MNGKSLMAMGLASLAFRAFAAEQIERIETIDGRVYEEVSGVRASPAKLSFTHRDGVASVPFEQLPPSIRARFGYDPDKASAQRKLDEEQARELARYEESIARELERMKGEAKERGSFLEKARAQIRHLQTDGTNSHLRASRKEWAKRYLSAAGIRAPRQDQMIRDWIREDAAKRR